MKLGHFYTMVTFVVGAVFVTIDVGFDVALLKNYIDQDRADEVCKDKYWNVAHIECREEHGNYPAKSDQDVDS